MENFLPVALGTCAYCGCRDEVVRPARCRLARETSDADGSNSASAFELAGEVGTCDVCAYALGHAWKRARGERVAAVVPYLARTYVLLPRLRAGRSAQDVSAYEFLAGEGGGLPSIPFLRKKDPGALAGWLEEQYGVVTWSEVTKTCYLGYSGDAEFSEVVFARAWGRTLDSRGASLALASFASLLSEPTPDAGFYLGVKAAFEGLLWRAEVAPEGNSPCVFMREPAVRYLRYQLADDAERAALCEDEAMVSACQSVMSPEELEVAACFVRAREAADDRSRAAVAREEARIEERGVAFVGEDDEDEDQSADEGGEDGQVGEGFVRARRPLAR